MLPSNVTLGQYIRFSLAAMFSMFLGSQVIHNTYKPLHDLRKFIDEELNNSNLSEDQKKKVKELL